MAIHEPAFFDDRLPRFARDDGYFAVIANVVRQSMNPLFSTMDRRAGRHCEERSDAAIAMTVTLLSLRTQCGNPRPWLAQHGWPGWKWAGQDSKALKNKYGFATRYAPDALALELAL